MKYAQRIKACHLHMVTCSAAVLVQEDNIHHSYGNIGDKKWDWELVELCIPTEDCLCPPVGSPTISGLIKPS